MPSTKYTTTACSKNGKCGPACVTKRISRGYSKEAIQDYKQEKQKMDKINNGVGAIALAGAGTTDVIIPAASGAPLSIETMGITAGVGAAVLAGQSLRRAYNRGKKIDESILSSNNGMN